MIMRSKSEKMDLVNKVVQSLEKLPFLHLALISLVSFIIIFYKCLYNTTTTTRKPKLPSPRKLPIIGNLHQLGRLPHRSLRSLSERYGDLMLLHLGTKPTLVVSSANGAEEIMKTHDTVFANRPYSKIASLIVKDGKDIAFGKYGEHWRKIKSICVLHMLSNKKVRSFRKIREEEVEVMIENVKKSTPNRNAPLNLSDSFIKMSSDVVLRVSFGKKYGEENNVGVLFSKFIEVLGSFSIGIFIPWLSWVDEFSGVLFKARKVARSLNSFFENRIVERIHGFDYDVINQGDNKTQDFVDVLLEIQSCDSSIDIETVKAVLMNMVAAGIETTATVLEWTMSELLMDPLVMKRLQEEVRGFLRDKTVIDEDDLKDMMYLKAVIKESLRLHPPLPFLLFREASQDHVRVQNYDIRAGTLVIINAWAIQRHPSYWEEPEEFRPERFLNYSGHDFEFIPFGAGRRGCPGIAFANVEAELALANLVGQFNWELPNEVNLDSFMAESFGTSLRRRDPLMAIPTPFSNY
ncbi:cytochrome P450 71A26-like [Silene latifolia]|uniref:cytochrome P450 71A26-like n=1 Tax=Silene latifolia TaxID=37657 RepID=UPI003D77EF46